MDLSVSAVSVVMLLSTLVCNSSPQKTERIVPRIVPRLSSSLNVTCEGFFKDPSKWKVLRNISGKIQPCYTNTTNTGPCHIQHLYPVDSGEYWCESNDKLTRSERVSITFTDNDLVLEIPFHPVMVGDNVTLRCIIKKTKDQTSSKKFFFYINGTELPTSLSEEMTIHNISMSHQGLYKCSTSNKTFSGESLLRVRAVLLQCPDRPVMKGTNVTLICIDKMAAPIHTLFFYKDDEMIKNSSSGKLTLTVSKSDEGVYKCRSSEGRESEEQWLAVKDDALSSGPDVPGGSGSSVSPLIALVLLPLLLLVVWFIHKRLKARRNSDRSETGSVATRFGRPNHAREVMAVYSEIYDVEEPQPDGKMPYLYPVSSGETGNVTYSTVNKPKKEMTRGPSGDVYSTANKKKKNRGPNGDVYSAVNKKKSNRGPNGDVYSVVNKKKNKSGAAAEDEDNFYALAR